MKKTKKTEKEDGGGSTSPKSYQIIRMRSLEEVAEPLKSLGIAFLFGDAAHEDVNRPAALIPLVLGLNPQCLSQLVLGDGARLVDLVPEDDDGHFFQLRHVQDALQLDPALFEALEVRGVDQIDDAVNIRDIVPPGLARGLVASKIPSLEGDLAHRELFGVRLLSGIHLLHNILLQPQEQGGLAGIVEPEEHDLRFLVHQAQALKR